VQVNIVRHNNGADEAHSAQHSIWAHLWHESFQNAVYQHANSHLLEARARECVYGVPDSWRSVLEEVDKEAHSHH
jgi:hypothetical protein